MKIDEYFTLEEMIATSYYHLDNTPSAQHIVNLCALVHYILMPLRLYMRKPVMINSGFRCPRLNSLVGGVQNSQHLTGCAADIHVSSEAEGLKMFAFLKQLYYVDQLLFEHSKNTRWLHVSFSWEPRHNFIANYQV